VQYGKKWQFMAMIGYVKNLGTAKDILATDAGAADPNYIYLNGNSEKGLVQTYRFTPTVICNLGKLMFGLEYNHSAAQFGDSKTLSRRGVAENDLHWINNERFTFVAKYSF
jgi:hypothetical protein